jgi:predicted MPP superfamily phosphohydrolase
MPIPVLIALLFAGLVASIYAFAIEPQWLRIRYRSLHVSGWEPAARGLRIVHLSDLHVGHSNERLNRFIARAAVIPCDVVVITGDFVQSYNDLPGLLGVLAPLLNGTTPVIGVLGNHDRYIYGGRRLRRAGVRADAAPVISTLRNAGVALLIDSAIQIQIPSGLVTFAGLDIDSHTPEGVAATLSGLDLTRTVLLAHSPDIHRAAHHAGAKVLLAGHTHGGQVRLGPWMTPTTSTTYRLKPPSGIHTRGESVMHVSPGLGTTMLPIRFFSRPEVTVVEVCAAER